MSKILYVDMDSVLVDFDAAIDLLDIEIVREYAGRLAEVPGIFSSIEPMPDAIESLLSLINQIASDI